MLLIILFSGLGISSALSSNEKMVQKIMKKKLKLEERIERKKVKKEQKNINKKRQNLKISEAYVKSENDQKEIGGFDSKVFAAPYNDPEMTPNDLEIAMQDPENEMGANFDPNSTHEGSGASMNDDIEVDLEMTPIDHTIVQHVPEPRIRVGPNFPLPLDDEPLYRRPKIKMLNNSDGPNADFTDIKVSFGENDHIVEKIADTEIENEKLSMSEKSIDLVENLIDYSENPLVLRTNKTSPSQSSVELARSYDHLKFSALAALKAKYHPSLKVKNIMSLPVNENRKNALLASYQGISTSQKLVSRFQRFPDGDGRLTCFTCHEKTMEECYEKGKMVHCWESDACLYRYFL